MGTERERLLDAGAPVVEASSSGRFLRCGAGDFRRDPYAVATRVVCASVILGAAVAFAGIASHGKSLAALGAARNSARFLDDVSLFTSDATRPRVEKAPVTGTRSTPSRADAAGLRADPGEETETESKVPALLGSLPLAPLAETAGEPNEWGTKRNSLPWWTRPGAVNAGSAGDGFPDSGNGRRVGARQPGRLGRYAEAGESEIKNDETETETENDSDSGEVVDVSSTFGGTPGDAEKGQPQRGGEVSVTETVFTTEPTPEPDPAKDHAGKGPLGDFDALSDIELHEAERAARVAARVAERASAAAAEGLSSEDSSLDKSQQMEAEEPKETKPTPALGSVSRNDFTHFSDSLLLKEKRRQSLRDGYVPLLTEASVPLNPFSELTAGQLRNMGAVYESKGWEGMKSEAETRT
jgi:hypothetical protein